MGWVYLFFWGFGAEAAEQGSLFKPRYEAGAYSKSISVDEPTISKLLQLHYVKANDIASLIQSHPYGLLSEKGQLLAETRTNFLWIRDTQAHIQQILNFIHQLDVPLKQLEIEIRIVDMSKEAARDLGVKWGMKQAKRSQLNLDLGLEGAASAALSLATLGANTLLDLELAALERAEKAVVVASPKIMTADQQEASISSGEQIPYQRATSSGATAVSFVQAALGLSVIPHVTPSGKILMKLKINQDGVSERIYNGVPAIVTRKIETNVMVSNGETLVLGGIFQRTEANNVAKVPLIGSLPLIGGLFSKTHAGQRHEALLVFITPRVMGDKGR